MMKRELRTSRSRGCAWSAKPLRRRHAGAHRNAECDEAERDSRSVDREQVKPESAWSARRSSATRSRAELARLGVELAACQKEIERLRRGSRRRRGNRPRPARIAERAESAAPAKSAERDDGGGHGLKIAECGSWHKRSRKSWPRSAPKERRWTKRLSSAAAIAARLEEEQRELRRALRGRGSRSKPPLRSRASRIRRARTRSSASRSSRCAPNANRLETRQAELEQECETQRARPHGRSGRRAAHCAARTLADLREERSRHEVERARNDAEREHLRETCLNELNAQPEDLIAEQARAARAAKSWPPPKPSIRR